MPQNAVLSKPHGCDVRYEGVAISASSEPTGLRYETASFALGYIRFIIFSWSSANAVEKDGLYTTLTSGTSEIMQRSSVVPDENELCLFSCRVHAPPEIRHMDTWMVYSRVFSSWTTPLTVKGSRAIPIWRIVIPRKCKRNCDFQGESDHGTAGECSSEGEVEPMKCRVDEHRAWVSPSRHRQWRSSSLGRTQYRTR